MLDHLDTSKIAAAAPLQKGDAACSTASRSSVWFLQGRLTDNEHLRHFPVHSSPFVVGRRSNVSLCPECMTVSSLHAELIVTENSLLLRDLGSTNGTFVNGQRIQEPVQLNSGDIIQFATVPFRVLKQSTVSNSATVCEDAFDKAMVLVQFDELMNQGAVIPHYQSIVDLARQESIGYEVLVRSQIAGLESPRELFSAASQLNVERKLSEMIRWKSIQETMLINPPPHLFLNTHPTELEHDGLFESMKTIREVSQNQQITLEIHEAAVTNPASLKELRAALRDIDIGLAFDDFGAGRTRLAELAEVHPEYLKFDMSLVRSLDSSDNERVQMVATLVRMVRELGVIALAEGIETESQAAACAEVGFDLGQGFYFDRPFPLKN